MALLTVTQTALLLNVRPKTVRQLIHDRHLRAINITPRGKGHEKSRPTYRVDPDDLRDFQETHKQVPPDEHRRRMRNARPSSEVIEFIK